MMKRFIAFSGLISLLIVLAGGHSSSVQAQDVVGDLLGRINQLRAEQGLSSYRLNNALNAAAQNQASWMASSGQVSHTQSDGSSVRDRARAAGYGSSWVSENIYMGTLATTDSAWQFWLNSPIHYRGLTSPNYQDIGIGVRLRQSGGQCGFCATRKQQQQQRPGEFCAAAPAAVLQRGGCPGLHPA